MANTYFQFKHFRINQEMCGMKVCTDSCIFGAVIPLENSNYILDIGTGTGLLALMLAQRSKSKIDAIEIDEQAAAQAGNNAATSQFSDRISVYHTALQDFKPAENKLYDLIISNPPFFVNSLKSEAKNKRIAKHTDSLSFSEIAEFAQRHLQPNGKLCILLPPPEQRIFASVALKNGLHRLKEILVKDKKEGKVLREISIYSFLITANSERVELIIKQPDGEYTAQFKKLLKDFYLSF